MPALPIHLTRYPRKFPMNDHKLINERIEEETLPYYEASAYYPVRLGEELNSRYQILAKLGYGVTSTVWLAYDLRHKRHVALKICTSSSLRTGVVQTELDVSRRLGKTYRNLRTISDSFGIEETQHMCLVHEPMATSLDRMQAMSAGKRLPLPMVKSIARDMLRALYDLHTKADVIHTDIKADNILITVRESHILSEVEETEFKDPLPRKIDEKGHTIYCSARPPLPRKKWGDDVLSDFGQARVGPQRYDGSVQPYQYRAPEILLQMDWSHGVDIWNLACLLLHLVEGKVPFDAGLIRSGHSHNDAEHLRLITKFIGPPPAGWPNSRPWSYPGGTSGSTLENWLTAVDGKDKRDFCRLIKSMMVWNPRQRPSAGELLSSDPWLATKR